MSTPGVPQFLLVSSRHMGSPSWVSRTSGPPGFQQVQWAGSSAHQGRTEPPAPAACPSSLAADAWNSWRFQKGTLLPSHRDRKSLSRARASSLAEVLLGAGAGQWQAREPGGSVFAGSPALLRGPGQAGVCVLRGTPCPGDITNISVCELVGLHVPVEHRCPRWDKRIAD